MDGEDEIQLFKVPYGDRRVTLKFQDSIYYKYLVPHIGAKNVSLKVLKGKCW